MSSTTLNNRFNNFFPLSVSISGPDSSHFGAYQHTSVDSSNVTIRALVPDPISVERYRKMLIVKLSFR